MNPVNVYVCTPSVGLCRAVYTNSLVNLLQYFNLTAVYPETPTQQYSYHMVVGSGISAAREMMIEDALKDESCTHVLFIDEDMGFAVDTLHTLLSKHQPIAVCNYRKRVPPADFTAARHDLNGCIVTTPTSTGLEEAYYAGFGFALIERKVFEAVEAPRFLQRWNVARLEYTTEDMPFYHAAREAGFPCWIDHDASKKVWHVGDMSYFHDADYSMLSSQRKIDPT